MGTFTYNRETRFVVILNIMHTFNLCEGVVVIFIILGILKSADGLKEHLNIRVNKSIVRENNEAIVNFDPTSNVHYHLSSSTSNVHYHLSSSVRK